MHLVYFLSCRTTLEHHCSTLNKAVSLFPFIRSELDSIKEVISTNLENFAAMKEEIFQQIKAVSKEALTGKASCNHFGQEKKGPAGWWCSILVGAAGASCSAPPKLGRLLPSLGANPPPAALPLWSEWEQTLSNSAFLSWGLPGPARGSRLQQGESSQGTTLALFRRGRAQPQAGAGWALNANFAEIGFTEKSVQWCNHRLQQPELALCPLVQL